jgi:FixJ family two-component response regulator
MTSENTKIFIIDDDESVRRSFSLLLKSAGYVVEAFDGGDHFLALEQFNGIGCILLDIFLDGKSGLELQEQVSKKFPALPIIYISGQGNIPMSVQALRKGAINFLQKPVDEINLFGAVEEAIEASRIKVSLGEEVNRIKLLMQSLTPREHEIYHLLITGLLNKQIAAKLNIAEHTVKIHRGKITEKLGVKSVVEMVQMAALLNNR